MNRWIVLIVILGALLGSCTVMEGDVTHWPASLVAVVLIVLLKVVNDRVRILAWPMEFLLFAAVILIVSNLTRLYFIPLPA